MNLSAKQYKTISNTIIDTIDRLEDRTKDNLSKTKQHFLEKITNDYHKKSYSQFTYFLRYVSNGFNGRTGESICNLYDKYNSYKYQQNIYLSDSNNIKLQELKRGQFLDNKQLQYANKKVAKSLYVEHHNKDKNRVFLTLTLPSKWHYYTNKGKRKNPKCKFDNYEDSITLGLKELNHINKVLHNKINVELRRFYKREGLEYSPYDYIKALEYHTSLTPHYHSIIYCSDEQLEIIEKQYNHIVKTFELEETVYEILENKKASSYVYKYLLKNSLPAENNNKENSLFNKYKSYFNNIRIFSSSNFKHTNQAEIDKVYKYISKYRPKLMKYLKRSEKPLYVNLEELIKKGYFSFEYETIEQIIVNKKSLENTLLNIYYDNFIPIPNYEVYQKTFKAKNNYVKTVKIKRLSKAYFINQTTKKKQLIYDSDDFVSIQKTDFDNEFFGIYEDEPDF
jgi:hypothetical protein